MPAHPNDVIGYWSAAGSGKWFKKDPRFDEAIRLRFEPVHHAAARGDYDSWQASAEGCLALVILLDQFPRNAFRGTPCMYATDAMARQAASDAIAVGHDRLVEAALRPFFYLPFGHSEVLADQERSVALSRALGQPHLAHAGGHHAIVQRFGRFPHRNPILGRAMRPEEQQFLDAGGYAG